MQADFLSVGLYLNTIVQEESARKMYILMDDVLETRSIKNIEMLKLGCCLPF